MLGYSLSTQPSCNRSQSYDAIACRQPSVQKTGTGRLHDKRLMTSSLVSSPYLLLRGTQQRVA